MKITDLLDKRSIDLKANPKDKSATLEAAVDLMAKSGKINDIEAYRKLVFDREEESTTGVGEGIAIPHGKGACVKKPGLAAMVIKNGVDFESLDDEPVNILFLIAAPDTKDNVHLDVLSKLSMMLMDEDFRNNLINAKNVDEFIKLIDDADEETESVDDKLSDIKGAKILAVTSCPTGIAHTYMAAEGLTVANTKRNLYYNPILYAYNILDGGIVDSTNIDVMIVEVGERDFLARIDDFRVDKIEKPDLEVPTDDADEGSNVNEWSFLRARDYVIYRLGIRRPVYTATLNQDCFDSKDPRKLYFYYADLEEMSVEEPIKHKIKEVFDLMLNLANEKGIDFLLMIPVDKYDLYQDHIVDNP